MGSSRIILSPEYGRRRQRLIFVQGLGHKVSRVPVSFSALEERARRAVKL